MSMKNHDRRNMEGVNYVHLTEERMLDEWDREPLNLSAADRIGWPSVRVAICIGLIMLWTWAIWGVWIYAHTPEQRAAGSSSYHAK